MIAQPTLLVVGAALGIFVSGWALVKSFFSVYNAVRDSHRTINRLADVDLPKIQDSLNKQDITINQIEASGKEVNQNVKSVEFRLNDHITRFEDTKKSVDKINDLFLGQAADSFKRMNKQSVLDAERMERVANREEHKGREAVKKDIEV